MQVTDSGEESGIPDSAISVLLNHLTDVRGIMCRRLDSHSGLFVTQAVLVVPRISQTLVTGSFAVKFLIFLPSVPGLIVRFFSHESRTGGILEGFTGKFHGSYVLLAACGREQVAYKDPRTRGGLFTRSLLKVLTSSDIRKLTYATIMDSLDMPQWQTPHREGQHINRRLFNKRVPGADGSFILGKKIKASDPTAG